MSKLLQQLHNLYPASREISDDFHLTADALISCFSCGGTLIELTSIQDFNAIDPDDETIAQAIFERAWEFHKGIILIHSPACSRYGIPDYECPAEELLDFIKEYKIEMLFDGDVIFLSTKSRTLTIFHHEGAFCHIVLSV